MIFRLLNIRFRQLIRILAEIGIFRLVILLAIASFACYALLKLTNDSPSVYYVIAVYLLAIFLVQQTRKDKQFLQILCSDATWLMAGEYVFLGLPMFICLLVNSRWMESLVSSALLGFLAFVSVPSLKLKTRMLPSWLIPSVAYEWRAGIRKTGYLLPVLWFIGLGTSFFTGGIPVILFLLFIFPLSFLEENESYQMIQSFERSPWRFLKRKIGMHLKVLAMIGLPLMAVYMMLHPSLWYIPVLEVLLLMSVHVYAVCVKYAFYQPLHPVPPARVFEAIGTAAVLIPVLMPLVWVLNIRFFYRAMSNLKLYLDDYH